MAKSNLPSKNVVLAIGAITVLVVAAVIIRLVTVPWPPFFLAQRLLPANTPAQNIKDLRAAYDKVHAKPFNMYGWNDLGSVWYIIGNNAQAIKSYEQAEQLGDANKEGWLPHLNEARVLISMKDWAKARIHLAKAHEERPDEQAVCMEYGDLLRERFWPDSVNELGQEYVDCINTKGDLNIYERLGDVYRDSGRYTEALDVYEKLLKLQDTYPGLQAKIGDTKILQAKAEAEAAKNK